MASSTAWASSTTAEALRAPRLPHRLCAPVDVKRPGRTPRGTSDDEGGPGDTPVSVRWLTEERWQRREAERDAQEDDEEIHPVLVRRPRPIDPDPTALRRCQSLTATGHRAAKVIDGAGRR